MKLSQQSFDILKNFLHINPQIYFDEPGYIKSKSLSGNITGIFKCEEQLPKLGIVDLREFNSIVSVYDLENAEFDFQPKMIQIKEGKMKIKYITYEPGLINTYGSIKEAEKYSNFNKFDATTILRSDDIKKIRKVSGVMFGKSISEFSKTEVHFEIEGDNNRLYLQEGKQDTNTLNSSFEMTLERFDGKATVKFDMDNFVIIDGDYNVSIVNKKMIKFENTDLPLMYFISAIA